MGRIINTHDQLKAAVAAGWAKRVAISICYSAPDRSNSRDISVPKWSVFSPFFKTDPESAWYDYGYKTFLLPMVNKGHKERKDAALKEAMEWVAEHYQITDWAKNRRGDYVYREINDNFPIEKRTP
jgi:hypothetical protein